MLNTPYGPPLHDPAGPPAGHPMQEPHRLVRSPVLWIFWLGGLFLILAPLSGRGDASGLGTAVKYARLGVSILIILIGFATTRPNQLHGVSRWYFGFVIFYFLGAAWSTSPWYGFFHKGMLVATCGAGLMMAHCLHSIAELRRGLRILGLVAGVAGVWVFVQYLRSPSESVVFDRLAVADMNANSLGQAAACLLLFALYGSLSERRMFWRLVGWSSSALLTWVVLATGSRGAVLFALISFLFLMYPHVKKRFVSVLLFLAVVVVGVNLMLLFSSDLNSENEFVVDESARLGVTRLSKELTKNTREGMWRYAFNMYKSSPVVGVGWANHKGRSQNFMSIYLQVLLETGVIGTFFFLLCLLRITGKLLETYRIPFDMTYAKYHFMVVGLVGALLVHGLAESSTLLGTTPNALLMGFALGMLDRLPYLNKGAVNPMGPPNPFGPPPPFGAY